MQDKIKNFKFLYRKFSKFRCILQNGFYFGNIIHFVQNDNIITFIDLFMTKYLFSIKSFKAEYSSLDKFL